MSTQIEQCRVDYTDPGDGTDLEGFLCVPKGQMQQSLAILPSVLVCHAFGGIGEFEEDRCRALAKLGFAAFAVDVYGKGKRSTVPEECFALMKPFKEDRVGLLRGRLLAAFNRLKAFEFVDQQRIAVIGFCFGGLCALDLARINPPNLVAAVSFHGTFLPLSDQPKPEELPPIGASVLVCHGDADTYVPPEQCTALMAEMRARRADWQFISYGNAKHGFTEPKLAGSTRPGVGYDERAANRSWATMLELFREKLKHG